VVRDIILNADKVQAVLMTYRPVPTEEEEDPVYPPSQPVEARRFKSPTRLLLVLSAFVLVFLGFRLGKWYSTNPDQLDESLKDNVNHSVGDHIELPDTEMSHEKRNVA
jgi:hypothetical protein